MTIKSRFSRQLPIILMLVFFSVNAFSQNNPGVQILGLVGAGRNGVPLPFAAVELIRLPDSALVRGVQADSNGKFAIKQVADGNYLVRVVFIGFRKRDMPITVAGKDMDMGLIRVRPEAQMQREVEIVKRVAPTTAKGDTTQYNASSFKTNPNATAADLVEKMPGITMQNGKVSAQGEDVKQVLVDGKPFFGEDPNASLKNLPAELIDKIQVFDQASEMSRLTGMNDGNTSKTMNIITRADRRSGKFGKVYGGYGTNDRYDAGGVVNIFEKNRRISILGQSNNINTQNFSLQDILGATGGGGRGGGGGGGGMFGGGRNWGGNNDMSSFMVGQQSGITTTNAMGFNLSDSYGNKTELTASYFFNRAENIGVNSINRQYVLPKQSGQTYTEANNSKSININHRFSMRLTYKLDTSNTIIFRPQYTFQTNNGTSDQLGQTLLDGSKTLNKTNNASGSDLSGYNVSNQLLFRHKFAKVGRSLSVDLNGNASENQGNSYQRAENDYTLLNGLDSTHIINQASTLNKNGFGTRGNISYTEATGTRGMLELFYTLSTQNSSSDKNTKNLLDSDPSYSKTDTLLTNKFNSLYIQQQAGSSWRYQNKTTTLMFRAAYQHATLHNNKQFPVQGTLDRSFDNFIPSAMLRVNFTEGKSLRMFYNTSTNPPSVDQLQNIINNSNPLQLSTGNPNLQQDYSHNLMSRYTTTSKTGHVFFVMLGGTLTNNYIGSKTTIATENTPVGDGKIILSRGAQLISPVNMDGYYNLRTFSNYGLPIPALKINTNFGLTGTYTRTPGMVNEGINYANSLSYGGTAVISSNISKMIDFTLSSITTISDVKNTLQTGLDSKYYNQQSSVKLNWIIWNGIEWETRFTHTLYTGLSSGYNQNYALLNMSVSKYLDKAYRAQIKLTAFDMLNQNQAVTRSVSSAYVQDTRNNVLTKYYMLSFIYNIKMGSKPKEADKLKEQFGPGMMPPGMMPGGGMPGGIPGGGGGGFPGGGGGGPRWD